MILYDGVSDIDWFYDGKKTAEDMKYSDEYRALFDEPCILYDNASGKVYGFDPLDAVASRWGVPYYGSPDDVFGLILSVIDGTYNAPGVDRAVNIADEAKAIAEQAGTDPQLQALASMWVMTMDLSPMPSSDLATFRDYWPEWQTDHEYKKNDALRYEGLYYRVSQLHTSQAIYPPDTAGESLYYPVTIAPDGIIVYRECHGAYDMVTKGETRHYPDAEGPVYRAKVDTAYDPDTVPDNWELVDGTDTGETTTPEEPTEEPEPEHPETAPEFIQPTGAHDAYGIGDRVTYNGKVYESTMAGNVYSPDAYPAGWKLVE